MEIRNNINGNYIVGWICIGLSVFLGITFSLMYLLGEPYPYGNGGGWLIGLLSVLFLIIIPRIGTVDVVLWRAKNLGIEIV